MRLQAIVFDYDGVLADTEPLHLLAFQRALAPRGVTLARDRYFEDLLGLDDEGVFEAVSAQEGLGWTRKEVAVLVEDKALRFREATAERRVLFPGVAERLRQWSRAVPIAIASGSLRHEIEHVLEAESILDVVPVIVAAGETENGKPAPDPYLRALALLAARRPPGGEVLDASRSVAVEDSPWGIDSARAAGMKAVALSTSYPPERLNGADAVLASFESLDLGMLDRLVGAARRTPTLP
jgi:beta-phosphoglucomutase-like phosphatase (HAD superfamily)